MNRNTDELNDILLHTAPESVNDYLIQNKAELVDEEKPFALIFRNMLKEKGMTQQEIITRAGFSNKYGYRIISEEKHTRQRDYILRLCFAAECSEEEMRRLLKLYGFSPLYARIPRDAVLLALLYKGEYDISKINQALADNRFPELKASEE